MPGHELLTAAEMGQADALAIASGVPGLTLMENAGAAVAEAAIRLAGGKSAAIAVLCGPGNNGGDGFVAARLLRERGYRVRLGLLGDAATSQGRRRRDGARWGDGVEPLSTATLAGADLIIDALFGAGLARPLEGAAADMVAAINASGKPVLAVDVPSGLDGTTGRADGPVVQATATVTFFRLKPGHLLLPGRVLCGQVRLADIGIPERVLERSARAPSPTGRRCGAPPFRGRGSTGTSIRAATPWSCPARRRARGRRAWARARRCGIGAGLVTIVGSRAATAINATHETAVMVKALGHRRRARRIPRRRTPQRRADRPRRRGGASTAATVLTMLASPAAAVLDADALTSFAPAETGRRCVPGLRLRACAGRSPSRRRQALFEAIRARAAPVVLTPHDGEFKRLFGELPGSKLDRARAGAAELSGAVVILKGADTVIAAPDGRAAINDNAPPWLATAGAGDVLAGFVAGLLAQRMPAFEAACAAVWLHGACASRVRPGPDRGGPAGNLAAGARARCAVRG